MPADSCRPVGGCKRETVAAASCQQVVFDDVVVDIVLSEFAADVEKGAAPLDKTSGSVGGFGNRVNDFRRGVVGICD